MIVDLIRESFQQDYEIFNSKFCNERAHGTELQLQRICKEFAHGKKPDIPNKIVELFNELISILRVSEEQRKVMIFNIAIQNIFNQVS